ncbi:YkvA family protein [Tepidibacillus fermentans]|uniref:Uncharacterized membrane protein YkvA (DUF1232 family) n=1 Tax=Tepidibacillus fermentans TaxID=1281767 RepID=A0A4R3KIE2_9BACI|nr:YkvA family protein [Tepidibacillus fermentans]TCS83326.1 uncharacterized membrane protein YkvA (DUF1232 family) [Tepidibacillus fermentans]
MLQQKEKRGKMDWKRRAKQLKLELMVLYLSYRDPRVPWYAKLWTAMVLVYAFSPIDLIPDFIPILGYLDDLLLIPLGILLALRLIPKEVIEEYREKAKDMKHPKSWIGAIVIFLFWVMVLSLVVKLFLG